MKVLFGRGEIQKLCGTLLVKRLKSFYFDGYVMLKFFKSLTMQCEKLAESQPPCNSTNGLLREVELNYVARSIEI